MAQVVLENIYKSFQHKSFQRHQAGQGYPLKTAGSLIAPIASPSSADETTPSAATPVLRRINLTVQDGEFMVLVGPSGCGKSTLLRLIAGLEQATAGNIWVGDRLVNDLPPKYRDIAMVFQSYALYPHMTVYDNLAFGLRRAAIGMTDQPLQQSLAPGETLTADRHLPKSERLESLLVALTRRLPRGLQYWSPKEQAIHQRVQQVAQMLQIAGLLDRQPKQLSGGQKQRVALGRAMARNPQVFLMDEPLSNLDAKLRTETRAQIVNLQRQLGITTLYVTHDQTEAMTMGDRIAVMNAGQIQQVATPLELYHRPANRFVAEFIGSPPINILPVRLKAPLLISHPQFRLTLPDSWEPVLRQYDDQDVMLGIRPEHLSMSAPAPKNLPVQIERIEALGSETYLSVRLDETDAPHRSPVLQVRVEPDRAVAVGEQIWLAIAADKIHLFDRETGDAIAV